MQLEEQASLRRQQEEKHLEELKAQMYLDSLRREEYQRIEKQKARNRSSSVTLEPVHTTEVPIEVFPDPIQVYCSVLGETISFDSLMMFSPQTGDCRCLRIVYILLPSRLEYYGTRWKAEPISDAPRGSLSFDLYIISFDNQYYGSFKGLWALSTVFLHIEIYLKGRRKLKEFAQILHTQCSIRHSSLSNVYAVNLSLSHPPRLAILVEEQQRMSIRDLLETADSLNIQKATVTLSIIYIRLQYVTYNLRTTCNKFFQLYMHCTNMR